MRLRTPPGSTVQFSDPWSCPCARSLGNTVVKDVDGDLHAHSPRSSLRAATCAASAPRQRGHVDMRGFHGRVRIEMHHAAQKSIDGPLYASIWMCRPWTPQRSTCTNDAKERRREKCDARLAPQRHRRVGGIVCVWPAVKLMHHRPDHVHGKVSRNDEEPCVTAGLTKSSR